MKRFIYLLPLICALFMVNTINGQQQFKKDLFDYQKINVNGPNLKSNNIKWKAEKGTLNDAMKSVNEQRAKGEKKEKEKQVYWEEANNRISHYIFQPSEVKNIYDNNPARLRSIAQYKYIILNGVITDIKEERNFEFNYILEDYIEYKYYTIRLNGGVYFESRDANFVSNLSRGQQAYFVAQYTDKQSFNRPLFELKMYAGNKQGLISLLKNNDIRLNSLVAR